MTLQENNGVAVIDLATGDRERVLAPATVALDGIDVTDDGVFDHTGSSTRPRASPTPSLGRRRPRRHRQRGRLEGRHPRLDGLRRRHRRRGLGRRHHLRAPRRRARAVQRGPRRQEGRRARGPRVRRARRHAVRVRRLRAQQLRRRLRRDRPATPGVPPGAADHQRPRGPAADARRATCSLPRRRPTTSEPACAPRSACSSSARTHAGVPVDRVHRRLDGTAAPIGWTALGALSAAPGRPRPRCGPPATPRSAARRDLLGRRDRQPGRDRPGRRGHRGRCSRSVWTSRAWRPARAAASGPASRAPPARPTQLVRIDAVGRVEQRVDAAGRRHRRTSSNWGIEGVDRPRCGCPSRSSSRSSARSGWTRRRRDRRRAARGQRLPHRSLRRRHRRLDAGSATRSRPPPPTGDWIGLSEITVVDDDTVAVIERDKLNGPNASDQADLHRRPARDARPAR